MKSLAVLSTLACAALATSAQTVTLKVHHFLPAGSAAQTMFIKPWCDKIALESGDKMKCQIYPSMQLGGTPPQLFDQVKDGVVDVTWVLPGYMAGRFPLVEVFELPFMMQSPEGTSKALWEYVEKYDAAEFKDVKLLALHVHGDGVFHMTNKPIKTMADLKGLKVRAPTRQTNKLLAALGATPVAMPVPAVSEALAKSVIDGALVPYEVVPSVKIQELVKFHSETDPAEPAIYTSTFIFAMNKAKYESLPPDLKKVIDANSGQALSGHIGKVFWEADGIGKKLTEKNTHNVIPASELQSWKKAGEQITNDWVADVTAKGANGKLLLENARALIAKYAVK
ncbi:TRAP transporter substrate-binding protein [Rhodoferax sp.]|uniref:TRAP transporter substrate-binding protein n=1 Tax=Rhodoferax sp. TaxID=50421 RepID=UPI0025FC37B2|nr:TRAP transporter substrate-binding protein [Rhodoferax sp.]